MNFIRYKYEVFEAVVFPMFFFQVIFSSNFSTQVFRFFLLLAFFPLTVL